VFLCTTRDSRKQGNHTHAQKEKAPKNLKWAPTSREVRHDDGESVDNVNIGGVVEESAVVAAVVAEPMERGPGSADAGHRAEQEASLYALPEHGEVRTRDKGNKSPKLGCPACCLFASYSAVL
jgi:hypothetical protein